MRRTSIVLAALVLSGTAAFAQGEGLAAGMDAIRAFSERSKAQADDLFRTGDYQRFKEQRQKLLERELPGIVPAIIDGMRESSERKVK